MSDEGQDQATTVQQQEEHDGYHGTPDLPIESDPEGNLLIEIGGAIVAGGAEVVAGASALVVGAGEATVAGFNYLHEKYDEWTGHDDQSGDASDTAPESDPAAEPEPEQEPVGADDEE